MVPKNVLIVEDERITAKYIKGVLLKMKIDNVTTAYNAKDAFGAVANETFDLVLMDINLNGPIDGIDLSNVILEQYKVPVIFITAYTDDETLNRTYDTAPYGFLSKPFLAKDLEIAVNIAHSRFKLEATKITQKTVLIKINDDYDYDIKEQKLIKNGTQVNLNYKQNRLLYILVKNINHYLSHDQLMNFIWEREVPSETALRNLVYSLRKSSPNLNILTSSKIGYSLQQNSLT